MKKKQLKRWQIGQLAISIIIILLVIFISSRINFRIDLTEDKRFTVNPSTKQVISDLEDIIFFKIYLDGDLPSDFKELRQAVMDMLNEFTSISPLKIQYDFVNPSENPDVAARRDIYKDLIEKGLRPYTIRTETKDGVVQKYVFPSLTASYREKQIHINLLYNNANNPNVPLENLVNEAKERLEYSLLNAIKRVTTFKPKAIGFVNGYKSLELIETDDAAMSLSEMYSVQDIVLNEQLFGLVDTMQGIRYETIIFTKPKERITDKDKYIIDQYIMHGGKVLWLLDYIDVNMDSLSHSSTTTAMPLGRTLNLDDMLFKYGARINSNIIQDLSAGPIPVNTAIAGASPQYTPVPWVYFPVIIPKGDHPITRLVESIKLEFPSTIDTIATSTPVSKKILLTSSDYSRAVSTPSIIDLNILNNPPNPNTFKNKPLPVAVLLEGEFESIFRHRIVDEIMNNPIFRFKGKSNPTAMIVVSDGDIIKNYYSKIDQRRVPYPLGADKWFQDIYYAGNKDFILNAVNYLTGDSELITLRGRKLKLRMLDKNLIINDLFEWQIINTVLPIVIVIIIGLLFTVYRKRKYTK